MRRTVITLFIVLSASFVGLVIRLAADTWRWSDQATVPRSGQASRARPAPAELPRPAGATPAKPVGDEADWITADDYPVASLRANEQGTTSIRWRIDTRGRVSRCGVVASSGYPRLDAAACRAIVRSGRYTPARTADGIPISTTKTRRVVWRLPD